MIPTSKSLNPHVGAIMYDKNTHEQWVYVGTSWIPLYGCNTVLCVVCNKPIHKIEKINDKLLIPDHPFCSNNLEYLEWQSEKKERFQNHD